jgi:cytochrome c-type biogenesis protein
VSKLAPTTPAETPKTSRPLRTASIVVGALVGVAVGIGALFVFASWLLPESALDGALAGPAGVVVAFIVGTVSFFSPCVLPLLPGYLSFASGLNGEEMESARGRARVLAGTGLFVLGFAVVFSALGATAGWIGSRFVGPGAENYVWLTRIAGVIVLVMGLAFVVPGFVRFMEVERRPLMGRVKPGVGGAFPLGLAFAVGWTPCVGPGLGAILGLGGKAATATRGTILLFSFSLGFGLWFVLAGLALRRATVASVWLRAHARALQTSGGVFMLAIGVLLLTGTWESLFAPLQRLINTFAPPV